MQRSVKAISWLLMLWSSWLAYTGMVHGSLMMTGVALSLVTMTLLYILNQRLGYLLTHTLSLRIIPYFVWLVRLIALSSWDVTRRVWQLKPDISPTLEWVAANQKTPVGLTLFGLSITLTPGTVAILVEPGKILVHGLTKNNIESLLDGSMDHKIVSIGG